MAPTDVQIDTLLVAAFDAEHAPSDSGAVLREALAHPLGETEAVSSCRRGGRREAGKVLNISLWGWRADQSPASWRQHGVHRRRADGRRCAAHRLADLMSGRGRARGTGGSTPGESARGLPSDQ